MNTSINTPTNKKLTKVSMIEDIADIRQSVMTYINMHEEFETVDAFDSVESFINHFDTNKKFDCDILFLDIGLPGVSGIEGIPLILERNPNLDIIMLTTFEEEEKILAAIFAGACSYVSKKSSLAQIVEALRIVKMGGSYMSPSIAREIVLHIKGGKIKKADSLTERQHEILQLLTNGKSYRQIAETLFISIETVRSHVKKMYKFLQVRNKTEAITLYLQGKIK